MYYVSIHSITWSSKWGFMKSFHVWLPKDGGKWLSALHIRTKFSDSWKRNPQMSNRSSMIGSCTRTPPYFMIVPFSCFNEAKRRAFRRNGFDDVMIVNKLQQAPNMALFFEILSVGNWCRLPSNETIRVWKKWEKVFLNCHDWWTWDCWECHVRHYAAEVADMRPKVMKSRILLHLIRVDPWEAGRLCYRCHSNLWSVGNWMCLDGGPLCVSFCSPCSLNTKNTS